ncbi:membrane dipeptidase [Brevundimonas nasdae]|uniref:dipeptidase n=1 Tax=Brevundimonas nasdae TaxID=172043 RepID=UPI001913B9F4|nr:membrane dipeptidase [Brevundimonas nasdae]MBK6024332.1 membrane dipeptidase [Brevundimonas nasdae]MDQ0450990.1 membrane dipeptidase [Brevundimonas nasdae]
MAITRAISLVTAVSALALLGGASAWAQAQNAEAVHRAALVLDGHADVLLPSTPERYYLPNHGSRVDLDHLTRGGVDAVVLSVAVGPGPRDAAGQRAARAEADEKLAKIKAFAADNPQRVGIALSANDVTRLVGQGKVAVIIGFQNARSIGDDLSQIDAFYREGVRVFAFNHAGHNAFSDSSRPVDQPVAEHHGLSPVGRAAVAKLNDLGVLIDVSQLSSEALAQTLALTRAPVAATHSNVRALIDSTRNLSDAELDAIKANGGIVQLTPFNSYLTQVDGRTRPAISALRVQYGLSPEFSAPNDGYGGLGDRQQAFLDALNPLLPRATVSDYVDQLDYVAKRIGWNHVGVGTDFNHGAGIIGFDSEAEAPNVTRELLRRGYTQEQINAIWSGNFLRVLRAAEAARRA